ncbi:MAG: SMC-Scp complex subunit ScpB [Ignavibacteriales bacterium]|nr:SMC-Scp complex subunit ScpB [Ignavibacteriales bacterium]
MQLAGGYVFATNKKFSMWVGKLFKEKARRKLSATALETLAIVAYKQPITKSEVEFIRGVNADYIMKTLLEKNLITIVGRATTPGRPLLYGTTPEFLKHFGINEITDLPKPREIEELIGETELEVDKRLLAEQQEVEFKEQLQENMTPEQRKEKSGGKKNAAPARQKAPVAQSEQQAIADAQARTEPVASAEDVPSGAIEENASAAVESVAEAPHVEQPEMPGALPVEADHKNVEDMTAEEVSSVEEQAGEIGSRIDVHAVVPVGEPVGPDQSGDQPQKGWSKWKTKLQTFFRKLFA